MRLRQVTLSRGVLRAWDARDLRGGAAKPTPVVSTARMIMRDLVGVNCLLASADEC